MAAQKTLLKWTEPWASAKNRAARSRAGWKIWQRVTLGFALGSMIFGAALIDALAKGASGMPMPERSVSDWIELWLICCFVLTGMFWVVSFIPQPRTVWIRERYIATHKRQIRWEQISAYGWHEQDEFAMLALWLKNGSSMNIGAKVQDRQHIEEILGRLQIPKNNSEITLAANPKAAQVTLKVAGWMLIWALGLSLWGAVGLSALRVKFRDLDADASERGRIGAEAMQRLKALGLPAAERHRVAKLVTEALFPPIWAGAITAVMVCLFGGMILWSFLLMPTVVKHIRATDPPRTRILQHKFALVVLVIGVGVFIGALAKERQWESNEIAKHNEALASVDNALSKLHVDDQERLGIMQRLRTTPLPTWITDLRKLIYIDALICAAGWAAALRWKKWIFDAPTFPTSPSLHPQSAPGR